MGWVRLKSSLNCDRLTIDCRVVDEGKLAMRSGKVLGEHRAITVIVALFFFCFLVLVQETNFPTNDDWSFAWPVENLLKTGQLKIVMATATCFVPVYLGAAVCLFTGFSFQVLHWISFAYCVLGTIGLYLILRELGISRRESGLGAALFPFNPLVLNQCFSYMTDIPALAFSNFFFYFCLRLIKKPSLKHLLLAVLFLAISLACRQSGVVFIPALVIAGLVSSLPNGNRKLAACSVLAGAFLVLFYKTIDGVMTACQVYPLFAVTYNKMLVAKLQELAAKPLSTIPIVLYGSNKIFCYVAFFCAPLLIPLFARLMLSARRHGKLLLLYGVGSLILSVIPLCKIVIIDQSFLPYSMNLMAPPIVGSYCLLGGGPNMWASNHLRSLTYVCALLAVALVFFLCLAAGQSAVRFVKCFCANGAEIGRQKSSSLLRLGQSIFAATIFFAVLCLLTLQCQLYSFDRYFLMLLVPAIMCLALSWRKLRFGWLYPLALLLAIGLSSYSLVTAADYVNFCRARNQAITWLRERGIPDVQIEGGPEHDFLSNPSVVAGKRDKETNSQYLLELRGGSPRNTMRWWPVNGEQYIIATIPLDGYRIIHEITYFSPLKFKNKNTYVLKSQASPVTK